MCNVPPNIRHQTGFMNLLKIAAAPLEILFANFLLGLYLFSTFYLLEYISHLKLCFYLDSAGFHFYTLKNVSLVFFSPCRKSLLISLKSELKHNSVFSLYLIYSSFLLYHYYFLALLIFHPCSFYSHG